MRFRIPILFALVVGLFTLSGGIAAQRSDASCQALLRAATDKELVDGDVQGAVKQYRATFDRCKTTDRAVAAQALLRMADVYTKHGDTQARATYEQVATEFGDQPAGAEARRRLSALGPTANSINRSTPGPICVDCVPDNRSAAVSPDGHLLATVDAASGDLVIRNLSTGTVTRLAADRSAARNGAPLNDFIYRHPVFSQDSRQIAYAVGEDGPHQLRVTPSQAGGKSRMLVDNPEFEYVVPMGWSPDGTSLLVQISPRDETWQIARVSMVDRHVTVLKSLDWRRRRLEDRAALSPDGRFIAYSALVTNPSSAGSASPTAPKQIYILAADLRTEVPLLATTGLYECAVWAPDGTRLLYTRARPGQTATFDLWSVPMKDGKAAGTPSVLKADIGRVGVIGMASSGSLYYVLSRSSASQVVVADLGRTAAQPFRETHAFPGTGAVWSEDGRFIASFGPPSGPISPRSGGYPDVRINSVETGEQRTYPVPSGFVARETSTWLHDGSAILFQMLDEKNASSWIGRVNVSTGILQKMGPTPAARLVLSSDDKTLYVYEGPNGRTTLSAIDLATWQATVLLEHTTLSAQPPGLLQAPPRPDDERLALVKRDPRVVGFGLWTLTADGSAFLAWAHERFVPDWKLMRVPVGGGTPEFITSVQASGMTLSPDGRRVAYQSVTPGSVELWSMDVSSLLKAR